MPLALNILSFFCAFVFGAVIGSFLNVLVYRIPRGLDFVRGRSFCPNCEHQLRPLDLIPIVSYLALGRKCRYCHTAISPRYLIVEVIGGVCGVCSWAAFTLEQPLLEANKSFFGDSAPVLAAVLYFVALCVLIVITRIDAETMEIPNGLVAALLICGILAIFVGPQLTFLSRGIGLFCVSVPLLVITLIIPNAFGGGDVKLMAAAGFLLGWQGVLVATFIGILIGGSYGVYLMASKKKGAKEHFAFGPALCVGIATALFFGTRLVSWYLGFL
jgi:leader peptidase (prepilin peptidase)/N-methyltransferase